jgi:hypothetical protein
VLSQKIKMIGWSLLRDPLQQDEPLIEAVAGSVDSLNQ